MKDLYIDSNVIVASEISDEPYHKESKEFMECVLGNKISDVYYYTSVFTFLELAAAMIRRTNDIDRTYSLLYRVRRSWKDYISPLPPIEQKKMTSFTRLVDTLIEASLKYHTHTADTIHAQTIAENEIDYVITWNKKHFIEMAKQIKKLKILSPLEAMEEFHVTH